jgi:hypothetical protein
MTLRMKRPWLFLAREQITGVQLETEASSRRRQGGKRPEWDNR